MNQHIKKVYVPMTETAFYILLCLKKPNHGYGIVQTVEKLTDGAGTGNHVRQLIQDGKGWSDPVYPGRR